MSLLGDGDRVQSLAMSFFCMVLDHFWWKVRVPLVMDMSDLVCLVGSNDDLEVGVTSDWRTPCNTCLLQ